MPRDTNGLYSLPAGNPVAPGTIITVAWANPTMSDVGDALTDSLDRYGRGGMAAPLAQTNGLKTAPSMTWSAELNSGLYRAGATDLRFAVGGEDITRWDATGLSVWDGGAWNLVTPLSIADGTADGQMLIWATTGWVTADSLIVDGAGNLISTANMTALTYYGDGSNLTGIVSVNGVPVGGTTGQVLVKNSGTDFDSGWAAPGAAPVDSVFSRTGVVVAEVGDYSGFYLGLTATAFDSALLGGEDSAHYHNAANLSTGTLNPARMTGEYNIDISGIAASATIAVNATNLNGNASSYYTDAGNMDAGVLPLDRLSGNYPCSVTGSSAYAASAGNATLAANSTKWDGYDIVVGPDLGAANTIYFVPEP